MARKSRTGVLKRQREMKKAEKAAMKREKRDLRSEQEGAGDQVATPEDPAAYASAPDDPDGPSGSRPRTR